MRPRVGVCMGSTSDLPVMRAAAEVLADFGIPHEVRIISAHRTPEAMYEYGKQAHDRGLQAIIAGAGGAAHLPGMMAALTELPVVGVPVSLKKLDGLDALLSIVQMPKGTPVATVAIDNAANGAFLALRMLAVADEQLRERLREYRAARSLAVAKEDQEL